MDRRRLIAAIFCVLLPAAAEAQPNDFTGLFTGFIGRARGGDIRDSGWTPGASLAVIDPGGLGAELDLSHVQEFDRARFVESGITTFMVNATGMWRDAASLVRPYAVGGVGVLRARVCVAECQVAVSRTDLAFDGGAGVFVLFNEAFGVRGDIRYFRYFQRNEDLPLLDSGVLDFWRLSIGGTIAWPIR